jgi:hypothetical protein
MSDEKLREALKGLADRLPSVPEWSHQQGAFVFDGRLYPDGHQADHLYCVALARWADEVAALTSHPSEVEAKGQRCSLCQGTGRMPRNIDIKQFLDAEHDEPSLLPQGPSGHTSKDGDNADESKGGQR